MGGGGSPMPILTLISNVYRDLALHNVLPMWYLSHANAMLPLLRYTAKKNCRNAASRGPACIDRSNTLLAGICGQAYLGINLAEP